VSHQASFQSKRFALLKRAFCEPTSTASYGSASPCASLQRINLGETFLSSDLTTFGNEIERQISNRGKMPESLSRMFGLRRRLELSPLEANDCAVLHLITPDEAIERIGSLVAQENGEIKQRLLTIAGTAIAAVIALDGSAIEVEDIDGLQASVNCALFIEKCR
jgi:hypothetical protein